MFIENIILSENAERISSVFVNLGEILLRLKADLRYLKNSPDIVHFSVSQFCQK